MARDGYRIFDSDTHVGPDAAILEAYLSRAEKDRLAGWAQYRAPIKNLYMCGSSTHPGGGIMGAPGRLAALEILKDWKNGAI